MNSSQLAINDLYYDTIHSEDDIINNINYYSSNFSDFNENEYLQTLGENTNFGVISTFLWNKAGKIGDIWTKTNEYRNKWEKDGKSDTTDYTGWDQKNEAGANKRREMKREAKYNAKRDYNAEMYGSETPSWLTKVVKSAPTYRQAWEEGKYNRQKRRAKIGALLGNQASRDWLKQDAIQGMADNVFKHVGQFVDSFKNKTNYENEANQIRNAQNAGNKAQATVQDQNAKGNNHSELHNDLSPNSMTSYCNDFSHIQDFTGVNHSDFSKQEIDQINDRWESILSY